MDSEFPVTIALSEEEREVLIHGLGEWNGPARCTDALAVAMDFLDAADLLAEGARLRSLLIAEEPLRARDWRRTLIATEFAFASDVFGSGVEWSITTGFSDERTVAILRGLQRKLARALHEVLYGHRR
ncbi:hypothetical protein ACWEKT_08880 [Nocardia takedensis]